MKNYKIKVHCNHCNDNILREQLNRCSPNGDYIWKDIELTNSAFYDFFVIFNFPKHPFYNKRKTIVLNSETKTTRDYIKTKAYTFFGFDPNPKDYLFVLDTNKYFNVDKWFHSYSYKQIIDTNFARNKNKLISGIISNNNHLLGHKRRLEMVYKLDSFVGYEHYGYGDFSNLTSYKGMLKSKEEGLIPYKYHFNCENDFEDGYFTEKFLDSLFFECFSFYDGCKNIENFFDNRAYTKIDINKPEESFEIIKKNIKDKIWEKSLPYIKQEKIRAINEYNPLEVIWKIIHGKIK